MAFQEAAHYIYLLSEGRVQAGAWKGEVENFKSKPMKFLQAAYGLSYLCKGLSICCWQKSPLQKGRLLEIHLFFFRLFFLLEFRFISIQTVCMGPLPWW